MRSILIICLVLVSLQFSLAKEASGSPGISTEKTGQTEKVNEKIDGFGGEAVLNEAKEGIQQYSNEQALAVSQSVLGKTVGFYDFTSSNGVSLNLKKFRGKPLVVSLVYTSCYYICPTITKNLNKVVSKARDVLGAESFNVLTIGFDTQQDSPAAMADFAKAQSAGASNWFFLSSDPGTMQAFTRDLGFIFSPSPHGFDHLIQATIVNKDGVVYRQVYGMEPQTTHFVEPLKELVFGEPAEGSWLVKLTNKVKLFCTVYDPAQDRYKFDYSIFVGLFVGLTLGGVFIFLLIREWRYSNRANLS